MVVSIIIALLLDSKLNQRPTGERERERGLGFLGSVSARLHGEGEVEVGVEREG